MSFSIHSFFRSNNHSESALHTHKTVLPQDQHKGYKHRPIRHHLFYDRSRAPQFFVHNNIKMGTFGHGRALLSIAHVLFFLSTSSAFVPDMSRRHVPRAAIALKDMTSSLNLFGSAPLLPKSRAGASTRLYMSDSPTSTANDSTPSQGSTKRKGILNRIASVVPPAAERQKLFPLGLMFFCILFNYTILRDTKDVLMVCCLGEVERRPFFTRFTTYHSISSLCLQVTAPKSGAEVIPFIKTYVNLPMAIVSRNGTRPKCRCHDRSRMSASCGRHTASMGTFCQSCDFSENGRTFFLPSHLPEASHVCLLSRHLYDDNNDNQHRASLDCMQK